MDDLSNRSKQKETPEDQTGELSEVENNDAVSTWTLMAAFMFVLDLFLSTLNLSTF